MIRLSRLHSGIAVTVFLIMVGIVIGWQLQLSPQRPAPTPPAKHEVSLSSIIFGMATDGAAASAKSTAFQTKPTYRVNEPLGLSIVAAEGVETPVEYVARLLTDKGVMKPLLPSTITLASTKTTFCCWRIAQPGTYTLQLLGPVGVVAFPLVISQ